MSNYVTPHGQKALRACMVCSIILVQSRFMQSGCPNCEHFLKLAGNGEAIAECTSQVFDGLITLTDPSQSWVAKWQRLDGYVPGVYAVKVAGILPEDVVADAERAGVAYVPRDGSAPDDI